jgi:hypothetical protein
MMVWMNMEMIGSMDVIWQDLGWEVAKLIGICWQLLSPNPAR